MQRGWAAICDRCGWKFKSYELKDEWTGLKVCSACWESRHPQDFVRGKLDRQAVPWTRPEPDPIFVTGASGTPWDGNTSWDNGVNWS